LQKPVIAAARAKLEDYLEANPNTRLHLAEICVAIGAAERTLRIAGEEHLGMGPIRFLGLRRMHLVRRALLDADSSTTVTRIVTDHGFHELGRFSGANKSIALQVEMRLKEATPVETSQVVRAEVRSGSSSAALTVRRLLPLCPDKQTFSRSVGTSQKCQQRKQKVRWFTSYRR
jgi:AraC-like DNA-binding protein